MINMFVWIRIVSAEPEVELLRLTGSNVELMEITRVDPLTILAKTSNIHLPKVQMILNKSGSKWCIIKKEGFLWRVFEVKKRPLLIFGILLFLIFILTLPGRILFVRVSGNMKLPEKIVLEQAEACGIGFGSKISSVRSEDVKNQLLAKLPELQWLGVTTSGCVATLHITERSELDESSIPSNMISNVVATQDGIITEMTVYRGTPLVNIGDSVTVGDILVSGYTDCGIKIRAEQAEAEIVAHTFRTSAFIAPFPTAQRGKCVNEHACYSLRIGKKVINLCNHSGIQGTTCVKMYLEDYWTLPGGFRLPVSIIKNSYRYYECITMEADVENMKSWLPLYAHEYLQESMVAGKIIKEELVWDISRDACEITGSYACHEMIGQVKYEEIIEQNAEDN